MFWSFLKRFILWGLILTIILGGLYAFFLRDTILRMGVLDEEVHMPMPGDGFIASPQSEYMQAITIEAPVEYVWGYLVQVGYRRAGWYNWDIINRLAAKDYFYEYNQSAQRIIPELQDLDVGDQITLMPGTAMDVEEVEKYGHLLLTGHEDGRYVAVWTYMLQDIDPETTRLLVRWRSDLGDSLLLKVMNYAIVEPGGAGIQQWQMLKGIQKRAEADYAQEKTADSLDCCPH